MLHVQVRASVRRAGPWGTPGPREIVDLVGWVGFPPRSDGYSVIAEGALQAELAVLTLAAPAHDQGGGDGELTGREPLEARPGDHHRPGRHLAPVLDRLGAGDVDHRRRG